jgi:hypothetical protein
MKAFNGFLPLSQRPAMANMDLTKTMGGIARGPRGKCEIHVLAGVGKQEFHRHGVDSLPRDQVSRHHLAGRESGVILNCCQEQAYQRQGNSLHNRGEGNSIKGPTRKSFSPLHCYSM